MTMINIEIFALLLFVLNLYIHTIDKKKTEKRENGLSFLPGNEVDTEIKELHIRRMR
jgi:hypothetical protein